MAIVSVHFLTISGKANANGTGFTSLPIAEVGYSALLGFFMVSGYLFNPERSPAESIKKRFVQLIGAYVAGTVILSTAMYLYLNALGRNVPIDDLVECLKYVFIGPANLNPFYYDFTYPMCYIMMGYYFFTTLFLGLVVFHLTRKWSMQSWRNYAISVIVFILATAVIMQLIPITLPWNLQLAPLSAAFILTGAMARKYNFLSWIDNKWNTKEYWIVFAVCFAVAYLLAYFLPTGINYGDSHLGPWGGWSAFTYFPMEVAGFVAVLVFCRLFSFIPYLRDLASFVGKYSLFILLFHAFFGKIIVSPFYVMEYGDKPFPVMDFPQFLIVLVLSVGLSIICGMLILKAAKKIKNRSAKNKPAEE